MPKSALAHLRQQTLLPLCLGAFVVTACSTPAPPGDLGATSTTTAPVTHPRAVTNSAWAQLQQRLNGVLGNVADAEVSAPTLTSLHLRIPVSNGFDSGSAEVRPQLAAILDSIVPTLKDYPEVALQIVGHTDSAGSEMYNLKLSIKRSEAVMEYLRKRGVALDRMSADGKGEAEPIANNAHEAGRARNRRVEIHLKALE
ncbi:OmpA family protein [Azoarcus sp. L1K30]|uniref:OmpA family protein n=1 Tax=Azoarcus sp. L1K30 TaxID=2820277 RepID=UPI001B814B54|nr:OmpA family protein [Azoarcus sp. L1K30]MBR0566573.1 OmpA family protein [Azoarcus sp. L1K30]